MKIDDLRKIIDSILQKTNSLKENYITEDLGSVDYVGIFPMSEFNRKQLISLLESLKAKIIYSDDDGLLYQLIKPIQTICLIKICNVDSIYNPKRNKIGYADYQTSEYQKLKEKYGKNPAFTFIFGKGWEILCLENPNEEVSVYIPNNPLSKDLAI